MKTFLAFAPKGGCGKTTLSRNVAVSARLAGLTVATLDTDPQQTLTKWWNRRPDILPTIDHYTAPMNTLSEIPTALDGIDLLVVDTPPSIEVHPDQAAMLLEIADFVIIPCTPALEDIESVIPSITILQQWQKPFAFVMNRVKSRVKETKDARKMLAQVGEVFPVDLGDYQEITRTHAAGTGCQEVPGSKMADDFAALWGFIARKMGLG